MPVTWETDLSRVDVYRAAREAMPFLMVGPVTWDVFEDDSRLPGGPVSFAARTAAALGARAHILTGGAEDASLTALAGHTVHTVKGLATESWGIYNSSSGRRRLRLIERLGRMLGPDDLVGGWPEPRNLFLAPLISDDVDVLSFLDRFSTAAAWILGQGLQREVDDEGFVYHPAGPTELLLNCLSPSVTLFLSSDEIASWSREAIEEVAGRCRQFVITKGSEGLEVKMSGDTYNVGAVSAQVVDTTGAGDSSAAAYSITSAMGVLNAGQLAAGYGAMTVERVGPAPMPRWPEIRGRVADSLAAQEVSSLTEGREPLDRRAFRIAIANQKGGVGKTTTAVSLAASLAEMGQRVLLVDGDPQANATSSLLGRSRQGASGDGLYRVLLDGESVSAMSVTAGRPRLDVLGGSTALAGAEIELVGLMARESKLRRALDEIDSQYDYILMDCPPALGLLTINSLVAADYVVIPLQCEYFALEGLSSLEQTIDLVRSSLNPSLDILGIALTMYDARANLSAEVVAEVKSHYPQTLDTVVPRSVRLAEAPSHVMTINEYAPGSPGAIAYMDLAKEVHRRLAEMG